MFNCIDSDYFIMDISFIVPKKIPFWESIP